MEKPAEYYPAPPMPQQPYMLPASQTQPPPQQQHAPLQSSPSVMMMMMPPQPGPASPQAGGAGGGGVGAPPMMLDVIVRFRYCGHRGPNFVPEPMRNKERRLRIIIDEARTAGSIRSEVFSRKDILPSPYQYLGGTCLSQTGFELNDEDLMKWVAFRGEYIQVTIDYRKDASKGYHGESGGACTVV